MSRQFRVIPNNPAPYSIVLPSGNVINSTSAYVDLEAADASNASGTQHWFLLCEVGSTATRESIGVFEGSLNRSGKYVFLDTDLSAVLFWNCDRKVWVDVDGVVR